MNDIERLRQALIDYFGTQAQIFPAAYLEVERVKQASDEEILEMASKYLGNQYVKRR